LKPTSVFIIKGCCSLTETETETEENKNKIEKIENRKTGGEEDACVMHLEQSTWNNQSWLMRNASWSWKLQCWLYAFKITDFFFHVCDNDNGQQCELHEN
jgi:hypothetical protein